MTAIRVCPWHPESYDKPVVDLLVTATDPDGDGLQYKYSTTKGTISGKGKWVVWDLNDAPNGQHEVRVTVTDGKGGKVEAELKVLIVEGGSCDPPPPPCPTITVSCPDEVEKSKPFVFSVRIKGEETGEPPSFHWKLNAGRIVKGQNGREIEATTTGANGFDNITATVEVRGFDPSCITTGSCSTRINW
jgi:Big-like domain-containing protein